MILFSRLLSVKQTISSEECLAHSHQQLSAVKDAEFLIVRRSRVASWEMSLVDYSLTARKVIHVFIVTSSLRDQPSVQNCCKLSLTNFLLQITKPRSQAARHTHEHVSPNLTRCEI